MGCGCCGNGAGGSTPGTAIYTGPVGSPLPGTGATGGVQPPGVPSGASGAGSVPLAGTQTPTGAALAPAWTTTPGTAETPGGELDTRTRRFCVPCLLFVLFVLALATSEK